MAGYRCRFLTGGTSRWFPAAGLDEVDAAQNAHLEEVNAGSRYSGLSYRVSRRGGRSHLVFFALVEVEGFEPVVSKIISHGIWRRGGVKPRKQVTLAEIAEALGWEHDPKKLLETWDGEEDAEE